ncbi:hypothetical protein ACHAO4_000917 [Trichoderma viride]
MPNLETLQIWNGRKNLAALFKYEAATEGQPGTITWKGTWEFLLQASLIQAWQAVVSELSEHEMMRVIYESIDGDQVRCHGDAMVLLELPEMVIRRVSLRQIQREQMYIPLQVRLSSQGSTWPTCTSSDDEDLKDMKNMSYNEDQEEARALKSELVATERKEDDAVAQMEALTLEIPNLTRADTL